ncbi:MAG: beta-ketoacyl synthase N-terminal-like domain-containing protein [Chloroflexota bacterium]
MASAPASRIAMTYGFTGAVKSVGTACSAGFTALIDSVHLIRDGYQDVMVVGGCDLVTCETIIVAWERMRILTKETEDPALACRPFDKNRRGIVLADGGAFFVLESYEHAIERGATILAEISGIAQSSDSVDLVKPDSGGQIQCLTDTLEQANLDASAIDMIYAHATGTKANDATEYQSLYTVFQKQLADIPLCALKSMMGHALGASGPMALVAALGSLETGYFYPIPNLTHLEEGLDIRVTTEGQIVENIQHILINTFAFGGINVSAIISKHNT